MSSLSESLFEFASVMKKIEDNEGVIDDEILPMLSKSELVISQKVDRYVRFYDSVNAQAEKVKNIIDNFKRNLSVLENIQSRLKSNVKNLMELYDVVKIEGNERTIKLLNSGGPLSMRTPGDMFISQEYINPKYIIFLDDFVEEKIVYIIKDKEKFKEAVKENKFPNCYFMPRSKYIKFI